MVFQDLWSPVSVELAVYANDPAVHPASHTVKESFPKVGVAADGRVWTFPVDMRIEKPAVILRH